MKKIISLILVVLCLSTFCFGCNNSESGNGGQESYVTITFKQDGEQDVVKEIVKNGTLTDVPTPKAKEGYSVVWSVTDFTNVKENLTVNAVITANTYRIYFDYAGVECDGDDYMVVTYDQEYVLPTPTTELGLKTFVRWVDENGQTVSNGTYKKSGDTTLEAVWDDYYIWG